MRSRTAIVTGLFVLMGGAGLSLIFHKPPVAPPAPLNAEEPLRHRADDGPQFLMEVRSAAPHPSPLDEPARLSAPDKRTELAGLPLFEGQGDAVPRLAQRYPSAAEAVLAPVPPQTRHRVVDGDTLPRLAERYLGDAARAAEIFEANRDVLSTPDLLPIGAMLRIPEKEAAGLIPVAPPAAARPGT